jgi:RNA polymerase sigma factor (sigma-70 family)
MGQEPLESTATLIHRLQQGDDGARSVLVERCLPALRRWAHGRLPAYGRDLADTDDLVQTTLIRALGNVDRFRPEREGAFLAYLRTILLNAVRDEIRKGQRLPSKVSLEDEPVDLRPSVHDQLAQGETIEAYERALDTLQERQRQAIILRVEFGLTFPEIAVELDIPSANAARMQVSRGLIKVAEAM